MASSDGEAWGENDRQTLAAMGRYSCPPRASTMSYLCWQFAEWMYRAGPMSPARWPT